MKIATRLRTQTIYGRTYQIPLGISRVDSTRCHGWQFRVKRDGKIVKAKFFGDTHHGSTENAFEFACQYADKWYRDNPRSSLIHADGVDLVDRIRGGYVEFYAVARSPNREQGSKSVYIGRLHNLRRSKYDAAMKLAGIYRQNLVADHLKTTNTERSH